MARSNSPAQKAVYHVPAECARMADHNSKFKCWKFKHLSRMLIMPMSSSRVTLVDILEPLLETVPNIQSFPTVIFINLVERFFIDIIRLISLKVWSKRDLVYKDSQDLIHKIDFTSLNLQVQIQKEAHLVTFRTQLFWRYSYRCL